MREFEKDSKINFVDENDVLVGFDNSHGCCESFGWFYSASVPNAFEDRDGALKDVDLKSYVFDRGFFHQIDEGSYGSGGMAVFKLINGWNIIYLCLHNSHNGYYSHGFTQEVGGATIREGSL